MADGSSTDNPFKNELPPDNRDQYQTRHLEQLYDDFPGLLAMLGDNGCMAVAQKLQKYPGHDAIIELPDGSKLSNPSSELRARAFVLGEVHKTALNKTQQWINAHGVSAPKKQLFGSFHGHTLPMLEEYLYTDSLETHPHGVHDSFQASPITTIGVTMSATLPWAFESIKTADEKNGVRALRGTLFERVNFMGLVRTYGSIVDSFDDNGQPSRDISPNTKDHVGWHDPVTETGVFALISLPLAHTYFMAPEGSTLLETVHENQ